MMDISGKVTFRTWDPATGQGDIDEQEAVIDLTTPAALAWLSEVKQATVGSSKAANFSIKIEGERETE